MTTSNRKKGSPSSASQNKKKNVRGASEEEGISPEVLPIDDPWKEKELLELNFFDYIWYLWVEKQEYRELPILDKALHDRIREVYRLCFKSEKKEKMKVINDFVAFHPKLAFNTPWLADLVKKYPTFDRSGDNRARTRLLKALGAGFRRAADFRLQTNRKIRSMKLEQGKKLVETFEGRLRTFCESENWVYGIREGVVSEEVEKLIKGYPCLEESRAELTKHILHKRVTAAAQLIVSKVLPVRLHDLKSKAKK